MAVHIATAGKTFQISCTLTLRRWRAGPTNHLSPTSFTLKPLTSKVSFVVDRVGLEAGCAVSPSKPLMRSSSERAAPTPPPWRTEADTVGPGLADVTNHNCDYV